jgi:uncharacterized cupin superfamily protein
MGDTISFKRLFADGDPQTGLSDWGPVSDDVVEGDPQQRYHYVEDSSRPNGGVTRAGVWEATQYTCRIDDYPCDEVCFMLEGSVTMIDEKGREETFGPGDAFLMPRGFSGFTRS